jgi:hypothetical protein
MSNTRLPCITNDGITIVLSKMRHEGIPLRRAKMYCGQVEHRIRMYIGF